MIDNAHIVNRYLAYRKKKRTKGEIDNTLPLMPFFLMDAVYQIYCKDIKKIECKQMLKKAKNRWSEHYNRFNREFFLAFNEDETDYIVEQMDEFGDYIHTTVVMLKSAVMDSFNTDAPFEEKKVLASVMACNVLAQSAQHLHKDMYRNERYKGEINPHIEGVKKASFDFASYYPVTHGVDLTSSDKVMDMIDVLCKKIVQFLTQKRK